MRLSFIPSLLGFQDLKFPLPLYSVETNGSMNGGYPTLDPLQRSWDIVMRGSRGRRKEEGSEGLWGWRRAQSLLLDNYFVCLHSSQDDWALRSLLRLSADNRNWIPGHPKAFLNTSLLPDESTVCTQFSYVADIVQGPSMNSGNYWLSFSMPLSCVSGKIPS